MKKIKIEKKTVEQLLAEVDYSWKGYTPSEDSLMFAAFIAEVNGGAEENKTPIMHLAMMDSVFNDYPRNALLCHRGSAKRQPLHSRILTPYGWIKMGAIEVGDELFDRNGDVQIVTYKTKRIRSMTYKIHLNDKSTYEVDEDHLNIIYSNKTESVLTTSILIEKLKNSKCYIPNCSPLKFTRSEEEVNVDRGLYIEDKKIVKQSIPVKIKLLKNIVVSSDADIVYTKNSTTIKIKNLDFRHDIRNMIMSLGGSYSAKKTLVCHSNVKIVLPFNLLTDTGFESKRNLYRRIVKIESLGITTGHCISVSGATHSYITDNYTVTHNTALFAEYLTLWKASFNNIPGFGKTNLSLYVADSIENGVKNLRRNVEFRFRESDYLNWLIPKKKILVFTEERKSATLDDYEEAVNGGYKFTDIRLEFENRDGGRHVTKGYGVNTGVKGTKELGVRPYDCTFDDLLQGDDAARSTVVVQTVKNTIYKDIAKALHPQHRKMIYLGTPYNQSDPLYQAVESGAWTRSVYPICEFFDKDTTIETFKGSWEDRFNFDYAKDEYDTAILVGQPAAFFQELMLQITSEEDKLLKLNEISWYPTVEQVTYNIQNYNIYATTDFASTEKDSADYSCMNIWAVDKDSKMYWIDGFMWKKTMDKNIDGLFDMHKKHNYMSVGIEITGQQNSYISWLMREMRTRKQTIGIARDPRSNEAGIRPITNKIARFNMILPALKRGDILFPKDMYDAKDDRLIEIVEELTQATKQGFNSRFKDQVDTISMLAFMPITAASIEVKAKKKKENNGRDMFDLFDKAKPATTGMSSYIPQTDFTTRTNEL